MSEAMSCPACVEDFGACGNNDDARCPALLEGCADCKNEDAICPEADDSADVSMEDVKCVNVDVSMEDARPGSPPGSTIASSASVSSIAPFPVFKVSPNLSVADVRTKLAQLIKAKGQDLIQACKNFDRRLTNKIPKSQLRQVIRMFCFPITSVQFDTLCSDLKMNTAGKINYYDFFSELGGARIPKIVKPLQKIPENLSIDAAELVIRDKVKDNLRDIIRAFWLFDINKDGLLQKTELRRIIRNYCLDLSDGMFEDLWKAYDPKATGIISYKDFLIKLGISADRFKKYMPQESTGSSLCWKDNKMSDNHYDRGNEAKCKRAALESRDDPAIQGMPVEEILIVLSDRLQKHNKVLMDNFRVFDPEKKGRISLSDFRGIINFFVLAMSSSMFDRVMKKLDIDVKSSDGLDYQKFLDAYCFSNKCLLPRISENVDAVCAPVVQRIKNRVLNPEARLRSVFTKINEDQEWQVTRPEFKRALELGLGFKLSTDEFKDLTLILDPGNTNVINCADIIHLFEETCDTECITREEIRESKKPSHIEKYKALTGKRLFSKLKHHLNKNMNNVEKAILVCDQDQSGFIIPERLKNILSVFCFPLSDEQFKEIEAELRVFRNRINYHEFLVKFKKEHDEDTKRWTKIVDKLVHYKSKCPPEMLVTEVEELLRDCIQARKTAILKDFKALDVCNVGVALKNDFRRILAKFAFRLTDKQFEALWETFPRNKYNQLLYDKFVEKYSSPVEDETKPDPKDAEKQEKKVSFQETGGTLVRKGGKKGMLFKCTEKRKTAKEIFNAEAPELKPMFDSMENTIVRNYKTIRYHLRRADTKVTDTVEFVALKAVLAKSGIYFGEEDEFHFLEYFDKHLTGKINYRDFLRIFVWYA